MLDCEQKLHLFWVCETDEFEAFLPLFTSDCVWSSPDYTILDPVHHNEFICQDYVCYICCVDDKGTSVLRLQKLLHQELVEAVCHAQGFKVGEIYPAVLSSVQTNQKFTACWMNEVDNQCVVFPIDFRDADWINETDLNSLNFFDAIAGDRIRVYDVFYDVVQGPKGKLHLQKSLLQIMRGSGG